MRQIVNEYYFYAMNMCGVSGLLLMYAQIVTSFIFFCYTFLTCFYLSLAIKAYLCNADREYLMLYCLTLLSEMNMALNSFGIYINSNLTTQRPKNNTSFILQQ